MVSIVWACVAMASGLLCYLAIPMLGPSVHIRTRNKIAQYYYGQAARSMGRMALVRRNVGGYSLMEMKVDDEKGAGKVVLDDSMLGDAKELHFDDPDNRMLRWKSKPLVMLHERVNAAVDAELAELGKHWREHHSDGKHVTDDGQVNPHFRVDASNRFVNIDDVMALVPSGSEPSDPGAMEDYTRKRFEKYRDGVGATETVSFVMSFAVGIASIGGLQYLQVKILDGGSGGGGGGGPTQPVEVDTVGTLAVDGMDLAVQSVVMIL